MRDWFYWGWDGEFARNPLGKNCVPFLMNSVLPCILHTVIVIHGFMQNVYKKQVHFTGKIMIISDQEQLYNRINIRPA